jgi:hypothetical protein
MCIGIKHRQVKLPSAATVSTFLCKAGSSSTADCINFATADGHQQNQASANVRVGHHAYDRSYVQFYIGHSSADSLVGANVSVEYSVSNGGTDLDLLITPLPSVASANCCWNNNSCCHEDSALALPWAEIELVLDLRFAWFRGGTVAAAAAAVTFSPAGLEPFSLYATATGNVTESQLRISLGSGPVGVSTTAGRSVAAIAALVESAAAREATLLTSTYGAAYAGHAMAIKGSVMWNLIYNPLENGAALLPVSRDWNFAPANDPDWTCAAPCSLTPCIFCRNLSFDLVW